ncbi:MAG: heavy-metal-associated domain-containing protein [Candidatus Binatia bacterium]
MKAKRLGFISAILASTCCVVPVGLALLGLGSLGAGSFIGAYHWYLTGGAVGLLAIAWAYFLRKKWQRVACASDEKNERATRGSLMFASVIVGLFVGLHLFSAVAGSGGTPTLTSTTAGTVITLPVRGMTCVSCELAIESNLRKLDGVLAADASVAQSNVTVRMKPGAVSLDAIAAAIRAAGYKPDVAAAQRRPGSTDG